MTSWYENWLFLNAYSQPQEIPKCKVFANIFAPLNSLNSIHSLKKINEKYKKEAPLLLKYLDGYYGKVKTFRKSLCKLNRKVNTNTSLVTDRELAEMRLLDNINMDTFAHETRPG